MIVQLLAASFRMGWQSLTASPVLALMMCPAQLGRLLAVTASQESAFDLDATGDGGASFGLFQFNGDNIATYLGGKPDNTEASQVAGACEYISDALKARPLTWWLLWVPGLRWPAARALWRRGIEQGPLQALANGLLYLAEPIETRARWAILATLPIGLAADLATVAAFITMSGGSVAVVAKKLLKKVKNGR